MTLQPMSARYALEVMQRPQQSWGYTEEQRERADAILTALVEAHEARCLEWDSGTVLRTMNGGTQPIELFYAVRALERGEEVKR